jgi:hypothetical protein
VSVFSGEKGSLLFAALRRQDLVVPAFLFSVPNSKEN